MARKTLSAIVNVKVDNGKRYFKCQFITKGPFDLEYVEERWLADTAIYRQLRRDWGRYIDMYYPLDEDAPVCPAPRSPTVRARADHWQQQGMEGDMLC